MAIGLPGWPQQAKGAAEAIAGLAAKAKAIIQARRKRPMR